MAEMSTTYISTLPTGSAGGSKYLVQDDGNNTTKVTVNDAVASATAITSANSSISSINTKIGSVTLPTTAQTLTGAIAEHESDITALNGKLSSIGTIRATWSYTIAGNGSSNTNGKTLVDAALPTGTTCIGIVGFSTNSVYVVPISIRYLDSAYSFQLKNIGTSQATGSLDVYALYMSS